MPVDRLTLEELETRLAAGEVAFAEYRLQAVLARGRSAWVFRARQARLNRDVALKVLVPQPGGEDEEIVRFYKEAENIAALRHPHIVTVHHVGLFAGLHYLVMDFIAGPTLAERLRDGPLPARAALRLLLPVVRAVDAAHQRGIIHRDIKPANIMLEDGERPMLADFGLAKRVDADTAITQTGVALGTPPYMAPEQARGDSALLEPRTDVYGLGATLFEACTGRPPFTGASGMEILVQVLETPAPAARRLNPAVPEQLDRVLAKCLAKAPQDRYQSAPALLEDLALILDDERFVHVRRARPLRALGRALVRYHAAMLTTLAAGATALVFLLADAGPTPASDPRAADWTFADGPDEGVPGDWQDAAGQPLALGADGELRIGGDGAPEARWAVSVAERFQATLAGVLRAPADVRPGVELTLAGARVRLGAGANRLLALDARAPGDGPPRAVYAAAELAGRADGAVREYPWALRVVVEPGAVRVAVAQEPRRWELAWELALDDPAIGRPFEADPRLVLRPAPGCELRVQRAAVLPRAAPALVPRRELAARVLHLALARGDDPLLFDRAASEYLALWNPTAPDPDAPPDRAERFEAGLGAACARRQGARLARAAGHEEAAEARETEARRLLETVQGEDVQGPYGQRARLALLHAERDALARPPRTEDPDAVRAALARHVERLAELCAELNNQGPEPALRRQALQALLALAAALVEGPALIPDDDGAAAAALAPAWRAALPPAARADLADRLLHEVRAWSQTLPETECWALAVDAAAARFHQRPDLEAARLADLCHGFAAFEGLALPAFNRRLALTSAADLTDGEARAARRRLLAEALRLDPATLDDAARRLGEPPAAAAAELVELLGSLPAAADTLLAERHPPPAAQADEWLWQWAQWETLAAWRSDAPEARAAAARRAAVLALLCEARAADEAPAAAAPERQARQLLLAAAALLADWPRVPRLAVPIPAADHGDAPALPADVAAQALEELLGAVEARAWLPPPGPGAALAPAGAVLAHAVGTLLAEQCGPPDGASQWRLAPVAPTLPDGVFAAEVRAGR